MSDKPMSERKIVDRPSPDDLVNFRFALPETIVTTTQHGVEISTCQGGKIFVPQSILTATEQQLMERQSENRPKHVILQARVNRNIASLLRSLTTEIARLTRKLNELQKEGEPKNCTSNV